MQPLVRQVTDNLDRTAALYEQILATEQRKQRAIVDSDTRALNDIVAREEELVALAAELEASRLALRDQLAQHDGRLGPKPRLRQVIALLHGPQREALTRKHQHLLDIAEKIHEVNRVNFQLLRSSLDLLRGVIDDVFGSPNTPRTYDPKGQPEPEPHDPTRVDHVL